MSRLIKTIATVAMMAAVSCVHGFSLPLVGTGTELNKWSRNMSGVLAAAKTTGYPIFLVMINDSSTGDGCSHCKLFVEHTLNTAEFSAIMRDYKFYPVLLNYWGVATGVSQPNYGGVSGSVFNTYFHKYRVNNGYPLVAVLRPDGTRYKGWGDPATRAIEFPRTLRKVIAELSTKSTEFALTAESGNTVTVQVNGSTVKQGTWKGVVTRSGGSGVTGSVDISLSGANAARYSINPATLAWDAKDGSKTFTVTGPSSSDGGLVSDTITVNITASGFDGTDISYKTSSQSVTFKDSRVKQSLAEFAAANTGLQGLSSSGGTWFVPASGGNVLETLTSSSSTLDFTAATGGILTVEADASNSVAMVAAANGANHDLAAGGTMRFGVAAGQKITFKATVRDGTAAAIGFSKFSFSPLTVTLKTPANGAQIPYAEMTADKAKVDLSWAAGLKGCTFTLTCGDVTRDMGSATSTNALDIGAVSKDPITKSYSWQVKAAYTNANLLGKAEGVASATFTVAALPTFGDVPATIKAYKLVDASLNLSVSTVGGGTVTYSATGLPSGMKINKNTGVISGSASRAGTYKVTVTAKSAYGDASKSFSISVGSLPKSYTKASYLCFRFSGTDDVEASVTLKLQSVGRWSATFAEGGRTSSKKGKLKSNIDGAIVIASGSALNIVLDKASGIWSGTSNGRRVYGTAVDKADAAWKGTWNSAVFSSGSAARGGWVAAKVIASGRISFTGKIANRYRITGIGFSAVLPASFVEKNLPKWAGHRDVRFVYMGKTDGGYALCADGTVGGRFKFKSVTYDEIEGSKWSGESIDKLNGATFSTAGGGNVDIPVVVKTNKMSAGKNSYKARITAVKKSGRVTASYVSGENGNASGVIYHADGALKAGGGGTFGSASFAFVIE